MYEELVSKMVDRKAIYPKGYRPLSLREKVLSLVVEANKNAPIERRVIPRSALTVMNRANASLSSLSNESRELGVLREVAKFITAHQDTFKAYEYSSNTDLLPIGHPRSSLNLTASSDVARERYAQWLSSDPSIDNSIRPLIATAHSLEPGSIERRHAFARLRVTLASAIPLFFKIDESPIKTLLAAFGFGGGNSSAARRARVALQWRDRRGRWVEMGRGIDFNFRFPNGDIGSAGGTYVGVNAARGYSTENGKPVANAGLVEIRGNNSLPDGIYSIESANATPIKARIPGKALKRAGVKRDTGARKPTAKESSSANIPNLEDLLKTRVEAPSGWTKQDDGSFMSDDDYKLIPNESGFALHRLDKDGNTGDNIGNVKSWAEAQSLAEKDSPDYDKFKESVGVQDRGDEENAKGIQAARDAQQERLAESIFSRRMDGESLEEVAEDLNMTREQVRKIEADYARKNPDKARREEKESTEGVSESGALPNGVNYTAESKKIPVGVFPGREPGNVDGVQVKLSGNTYPQRELIKKLGFKWNNAEKTWNKNFFESTLFGHQNSVDAIKEQLDGVGGGEVPRFAGDNNEIAAVIQEAYNEVLEHGRSGDIPNETASNRYYDAREALKDANVGFGNSLKNDIPNNQDDRKNARNAIESFFDEVERPGFPGGPRMEKAKDLLGKAIDMLDEKIGTKDKSAVSPAAADSEPPTAFTGVTDVENWSNETVNLYIVQALINSGELNDSDAAELADALENAYESLSDAREYTDSGSGPAAGTWTDLDNPPSGVIEAVEQALSPLEELKEKLDEIDTGDDKDNSLDRDIEEAKQQVDELIKELKSKLAKWEDGDGPDEPPTLWGSKNSIEKPDGKTFDIILAEMDEIDDSGKTMMQNIVDQANDLGIYVELSPEQTGLGFGDERIARFTFPEKTVSPELAKKLIGSDPDSGDGILMSRLDNQEDWDEAIQDITGGGEPPSPPSRYTGPFSSSGEFGKDITDTVVDGAESEFDMSKELEEVLDNDASDVGESIVEQMWDAADSRFDIQDQFNNNFSATANKEDFIQAAVDSLKNQLSDILEGAYNERRDLEDDDELEIDFDEDAFMDAAEKKYRELLSDLWDGRDEGPDEPPTPPDGGGGTPPKVPSPSTPSAPALFNEFDAPAGAFKLRTIDFEPDGRVDEESTDFTDDPERLAVKYTLTQLSVALTQALIGDKDDAIFNEIIESSIGDDDELLDLEETDDVVDSPAPAAGRANGSGAGQLEFNKGDEFVPAEALYNAIFLAGGDPNRVIANAYDAVNGNRNNLNKLHDAAGGTPDPDEEALIDDIFEEISQIKEASTPKETEEKAANASDEQRDDAPQGELLYNIPVDTEKNPDYYDIDTNPYNPLTEEPDENGYSDNPRYIATKFEEADLLEQFEKAIVNGSGSALLNFNPDAPSNEGLYEVRVEAVRDALQRRNVNTNAVIERILSESNDFGDEDRAEEPLQRMPNPNRADAEVSYDEAVESIKQYYDAEDDRIPSGLDIFAYLPSDGSLVYADPWGDVYVARASGEIIKTNVDKSWFTDPAGAGPAGWRELTSEETRSIYAAGTLIDEEEQEEDSAPEVETPSAPEPEAPRYVYPGPREPGYSPNNTTKDSNGAVVGKGARVKALKDGQVGTVVAVQNDPEYLRIRFDNGTTAVRSASKILAISDASGIAPRVVESESQPSAKDVRERLDAPVVAPPRIARSGETNGVNDDSTIPEYIKDNTNKDAVQSDFSAWGSRDAEIAKAANERISLKGLEEEIATFQRILNEGDAVASREAKDRLVKVIGDVYGVREGITFGGELFSLGIQTSNSVNVTVTPLAGATQEEVANGKFDYRIDTSMVIRDVSGVGVGEIRRTLTVKKKVDESGNVVIAESYAKNEYLGLRRKKTGFATAVNRYSENWYIANGIKKVKVYAAGGRDYQGGFVWALSGFNWQSQGEMISLSDFKRQAKNKEEESDIAALEQKLKAAKLPSGDYDMSKVPTPMEFARVGWRPGATDWLGKKVMIVNSWNGVKDLEPAAREQIQAVNNRQIANADQRVKSKQNIPNVSSGGVAAIESDTFRNNPQISPYYSQIRDVIRNNRSLATLSLSAKNALNDYISQQILDKDRSMPLDDIFRLREGLTNEYAADYGYSDPFNSAEVLSQLRVQDFFDAVNGRGTKLKDAGFNVRQLSGVESGVNATFEVTHVASGQVFYVKNDSFVSNFSGTDAGVTEVEASTLLKAAGMQGVHDVRVGRNDRDMVVMSRAGSVIPLVNEAVNASTAFRRGLKNANGEDVNISNPVTFVSSLNAPEDLIRMSILDMLGNNVDRHDGNWMVAFDQATNKIRIFPVDNTVGELKKDTNSIETYFENGAMQESDVYLEHIPVMLRRLGQDGMMKIYKNEIDKIVRNLNNPLYQPKGFEMDKIVEKWGTYDAFKDAISARLKTLTTKGTNEYKALENAMDLEYWD